MGSDSQIWVGTIREINLDFWINELLNLWIVWKGLMIKFIFLGNYRRFLLPKNINSYLFHFFKLAKIKYLMNQIFMFLVFPHVEKWPCFGVVDLIRNAIVIYYFFEPQLPGDWAASASAAAWSSPKIRETFSCAWKLMAVDGLCQESRMPWRLAGPASS